ncbi:MAG: ATP synthase F1 subunit gamma [Lachnospiraceae bacterium]
MASSKEIQNRIKSIKDTMKITNAMYMIASSKLRKAKSEADKTEPYFFAIRQAMASIEKSIPYDLSHIYLGRKKSDSLKRYGYLILTADKGLSGAYNHNIVKLVQPELDKHPEQNNLYVAGRMGRHYYRKMGANVMHNFHYIVQEPSMDRARFMTQRVIDDYKEGKIDELYIVYSRMTTPMSCEPEIKKLLPIDDEGFEDVHGKKPVGTQISLVPTPEAVLDSVVPNYIHGVIYGALVESFCSEQNSRMMAMQSATNNAKDMLHDLNIEFNRIRQAAITQEITEVIAGAKAQKKKQE